MPDQPEISADKSVPEQEIAGFDRTIPTVCLPVVGEVVEVYSERNEILLVNDSEQMQSDSDSDDSTQLRDASAFLDEGSLLGRYRIGTILGQGSFGAVYLAEDEELHRTVAIKVPHADHAAVSPEGKERYLKEARLLASLDHPHIVPIYDVGEYDKGIPYIVSKFVPGCTLAERLRRSHLTIVEAAEMMMRLAEALAYAHDHQVLHRDIKPGNIALENGEKPYLIDFGLAERESEMEFVTGLSGTPQYMSPEQAKGENHLVDARSDIYSLGVVFYELLVCEMPHAGNSIIELLMNIAKQPPKSLREIDSSIPAEIERIVLKCLAKKAIERYAAASELADDLRHWLNPKLSNEKKSQPSLKIVPKGLRSFEGGDSEFYLSLLPGTRDRDGLPSILRFWKSRLEVSEPTQTFRVGVIYGPSGCGKSSFVKAGLLPRLASRLRVIYVEATADETENRLLKGLERACPDLPRDIRLRDAINHLRRVGDVRRKVVLVIDQFEQWLHGDRNIENSELQNALRQCDGERVQCVLMVRDDYWLALNRFMQDLEIKLIEGQNTALIDLFDLPHARKVLLAFGRAYGALPVDASLNSLQEQFLTQSIAGLAQEEKVISVRLSLFAEMMKGRPWTPATLNEVGGADGIGETFLEETFNSRSSHPEHRRHAEAARGVLRALLPESGADIKGHLLSRDELCSASGYVQQVNDFDVLMTILDGELRLITPTAAEETSAARNYQLTHDYLVPSLREWLTRKQKETKLGRTELMLEDRSGVWNARPENRLLPSMIEWIRIRRFSKRLKWSLPQAKMMAQADRYYGKRLSIFCAIIVIVTVTGLPLLSQYAEERSRSQKAQDHLFKAQEDLDRSVQMAANLKIKALETNRDTIVTLLGDGHLSSLREEFDAILSEINRRLGNALRENNDARFEKLCRVRKEAISDLKILIQDEQKLLHDLRKSNSISPSEKILIDNTIVAIAKEHAEISRQQNVARQYQDARDSLNAAELHLLFSGRLEDTKTNVDLQVLYKGLSPLNAHVLAEIYHSRGETNWLFFQRYEGLKDYEKSLFLRLKFPVLESEDGYRPSQRNLAKTYGFLGDAHLQIANYTQAREKYLLAYAIRKKLADSEPPNQVDDKCMHARDFANFAYTGLYSGDPEMLKERLLYLRDGVRYYEDHFPDQITKRLPPAYQFERVHRRIDLVETLLDLPDDQTESPRHFRETDGLLRKLKAEFDILAPPEISFQSKARIESSKGVRNVSPEILSYFFEILLADARKEIAEAVFLKNSNGVQSVLRDLEFASGIMAELDVLGKANTVNYYRWAQIISLQMQLSNSQKRREDLFVLLEDRLQKSIRLGFDIYHRFKRDRSFDHVRKDVRFQERFAKLEVSVFESEKAKEAIRKMVIQ